ncbi:DsrE family protein, partial [Guyparkeria halopsychrophila]|uniref:DsrE family protein n=1 Tax=Guyparkeria halopsychrophila TaxID=3139421 RepID=UPI0037C6093A
DVLDAHIVVILHGPEIPLFTAETYDENRELMERAQSLTVAGNIEYRLCAVAAALRDVEPEDVHGFVKVVPMADAEIIELQHEGYAYMQ